MFNKSPENLWNAVFNVPQGLTMTIAVSSCVWVWMVNRLVARVYGGTAEVPED